MLTPNSTLRNFSKKENSAFRTIVNKQIYKNCEIHKN